MKLAGKVGSPQCGSVMPLARGKSRSKSLWASVEPRRRLHPTPIAARAYVLKMMLEE